LRFFCSREMRSPLNDGTDECSIKLYYVFLFYAGMAEIINEWVQHYIENVIEINIILENSDLKIGEVTLLYSIRSE